MYAGEGNSSEIFSPIRCLAACSDLNKDLRTIAKWSTKKCAASKNPINPPC